LEALLPIHCTCTTLQARDATTTEALARQIDKEIRLTPSLTLRTAKETGVFKSFEERLCDEWDVKRDDIYVEGSIPLDDLHACQPVRPHKALELLDVSEDKPVTMLAHGMLRRPGRRGCGRVAWRCDEIQAARELLGDIIEGARG